MVKRILTALVGIPIVVLLLRQGGYVFGAAIFLLTLIGWYEFQNMVKLKGYTVYMFSSLITSTVIVGYLVMYPHPMSLTLVPGLIVGGSILVMLEGLFRHAEGNWPENTALSIMSIIYIAVAFAHFILLRGLPHDITPVIFGINMEIGEALFWLVILGTWASDTFAYFIGCAFGRHKLCPAISPKKSVEGAAAGFVGCVGVIAGLGIYVLHMSILVACLLGIAIAVVAPLGDLVESILKRSFGVKDSGSIFPGHGGVLDRCDSWLFAVPVGFYILVLTNLGL